MSSDIAIKVVGLGKCYHIYDKPLHRLLEFVFPQRKFGRDFWALQDVSFEVRRGETFGIIGRNGAGKSTLLQLISGTLNQSSGDIFVNGRVAALLELGAGFNPEFTGRENVSMAASLYGLTAGELDQRFESIVEFADIGDFVDQPVKTYSSGMYVRLAFSLIAHVDADILIVDEALSVGDVRFQQKCMRFLKEFKECGGTLLFVSHDSAMVMALCDKALYLNRSASDYSTSVGSAEKICKEYLRDIYKERQQTNGESVDNSRPHADSAESKNKCTKVINHIAEAIASESMVVFSEFDQAAESFGDGGGAIIGIEVKNVLGEKVNSIKTGDIVIFAISLQAVRQISSPTLTIIVKDRTGQFLFSDGTVDALATSQISMSSGDVAEVNFRFFFPVLIEGTYSLDFAFSDGNHMDHVQMHWVHEAIEARVSKGRNVVGLCGFNGFQIDWNMVSID